MTWPGRERHLSPVSRWRGARSEGVESGPPFPLLTHLRPVAAFSHNAEVFARISEAARAAAPAFQRFEELRGTFAKAAAPVLKRLVEDGVLSERDLDG